MTSILELVGRTEMMILGLAVSLFLAFYWLVRGAPIGQSAPAEPSEAPSTGFRDRAAAFAVLGLILVLAGAYVAVAYGIPWSLLPFGVGYALIFRTISKYSSYRHVSPSLRRTVEFAQTSLRFTLLAGLLLIVNIFAFKYGGNPIDFTHDEAFTLSTLSSGRMQKLERTLHMTLVLGRDESARRSRDRVRQLADLYKRENPSKIEIKELAAFNPNQAADLDDIMKRNPDLMMSRGDAVVLEYGEGASAGRSVIPVVDLLQLATPGAPTAEGRLATAFRGEDAITSTVARFIEGKRTIVGFTSGHGEPSLDQVDPREMGLGLWKSRLASLGAVATDLNLVKEGVPAEVSLVVIVWPKAAFSESELEHLKKYLASGKPMIVVTNAQNLGGLQGLLAMHNITFDAGRILDPEWNAARQMDQIVTPPITIPEHPIIAALGKQSFLFPVASPLSVIGSAPLRQGESKPQVNPAIIAAPFLRTSPRSWSETKEGSYQFDAGVDAKGPLVVGMAAMERVEAINGAKPKPRLVVFSSPYMALNTTLRNDPANMDLLMNAVEWLKGKEESLGVAPKVHTAVLFTADPSLRTKLHLVPTIISVVLIVGFGVLLYLARRA